jgi:hypothetical protein
MRAVSLYLLKAGIPLPTHNRTLGSDRETLINGRAALEGELPKAACQQMGAKRSREGLCCEHQELGR